MITLQSYYSHDKLTVNYTSDYGRTWSPTYQKQWPPQEKFHFHFRAFWMTKGKNEFYPSKCHLYFPTNVSFYFQWFETKQHNGSNLQNNILSVASVSMTTTQRFSTVTEASRKPWVEGFKPKNPLWGEGGVWIFFLEPHSILKSMCMLFEGH